MNMQDNGRFRLSNEDETPNEDYIRSEINDLRYEKISNRVTLISILIPCIVIVLLVVAYLDIKRRVRTTQTSGVTLSKNLDSRFSAISLRQAKLEETIAKNTESSTNSNTKMSDQLKKMQGVVNSLQKAKLDKQELDERIKILKRSISNLEKRLKKSDTKLAPLEARVDKSLQTMRGDLSETRRMIEDLHESVADMSSVKLEKKDLDLAMKIESIRLQELLKKRASEIETKIADFEILIQKELKTLRSKIDSAGQQQTKPQAPVKDSPTSSESENILEQNIQ